MLRATINLLAGVQLSSGPLALSDRRDGVAGLVSMHANGNTAVLMGTSSSCVTWPAQR